MYIDNHMTVKHMSPFTPGVSHTRTAMPFSTLWSHRSVPPDLRKELCRFKPAEWADIVQDVFQTNDWETLMVTFKGWVGNATALTLREPLMCRYGSVRGSVAVVLMMVLKFDAGSACTCSGVTQGLNGTPGWVTNAAACQQPMQ